MASSFDQVEEGKFYVLSAANIRSLNDISGLSNALKRVQIYEGITYFEIQDGQYTDTKSLVPIDPHDRLPEETIVVSEIDSFSDELDDLTNILGTELRKRVRVEPNLRLDTTNNALFFYMPDNQDDKIDQKWELIGKLISRYTAFYRGLEEILGSIEENYGLIPFNAVYGPELLYLEKIAENVLHDVDSIVFLSSQRYGLKEIIRGEQSQLIETSPVLDINYRDLSYTLKLPNEQENQTDSWQNIVAQFSKNGSD